jgi:SAM-dependent methyltransferase
MIEHKQKLFIGAPRDASLPRTMEVVVGKLRRMGAFSGERLLDIGCGSGAFTRALGTAFSEVHGIDIQEHYLKQFREAVKDDPKFVVSHMSASDMSFPDDFFDTIVTIETLEHIPDLAGAARGMVRVLRPGGELLITVPNRWFPFENHGMQIGSWSCGRVPLLTYFPWLHRRLAPARVFTVRDLDSLFAMEGLSRFSLDYLWPTFEHGGNPLQRALRPTFGLMRRLERSPLRMFGTSIVVKYLKPA